MEKQDLIQYWIKSADKDYRSMNRMFKSREYMWALFVGHLVIEKLLKACYVKYVDDNVPRIHNLLRLAELCAFDLSEKQKDMLVTITSFNINARYGSIKQSFYKKCTKKYTTIWTKHIRELRKWIKTEHLS